MGFVGRWRRVARLGLIVAAILNCLTAHAAVAQAVVRQSLASPTDDSQIDPADCEERFVLLPPSGPLIVQATFLIDGRPFRRAREGLVDEAMRHADRDGDGRPTWEEAIYNPRFNLRRYRAFGSASDLNRETLFRNLDANMDGLVNRGEARRALESYAGGPAFLLNPNAISSRNAGDTIRSLLDRDDDERLSVDEMSAAVDRLKRRDADDNDSLTKDEVSGSVDPNPRRQVVRSGQGPTLAISLKPRPTAQAAEALYRAVAERYRGFDGELHAGDFRQMRGHFERLDANRNHRLEADELVNLAGLPPDVEVVVHFGEGGDLPPGLQFVGMMPELGLAEEIVKPADDGVEIMLRGASLRLAAVPQAIDLRLDDRAARSLQFADVDQNGYIERSELTGTKQQFDAWDMNADGKVFLDEIKAALEWEYAPRMSQVHADVAPDQDPLFAALDQNDDGKLGLRELRGATARLCALDANRDGVLEPWEIPERWTLRFARGDERYARVTVRPYDRPTVAAAPATWHAGMDRNADGDISPREFLGTAEQFAELDEDGDGLIDADEAGAAMK